MSKGDISPLARDIFRARRKWLGRVMPYAVLCSSGVSRERWQEIVRQGEDAVLGRWLDFPFPEICPALGVEALGDEVRSPIRSQLPVLMISGTLDMRTPVENAEEVSRGFPNGHHLVVEGAGHGDDLMMASPEIERSIVSFLQGDAVTAERIVAEPLWKRPVPHPPTVVRSVVEKLHGLEVEDPYRWLEDPTTPETRLWIETQTQTADSVLHVLPRRRQLQEHFEDLLKVETAGRPWVRGERYVYPRRNAGQDLYSIVLREGEKGAEQVLLDPAALSADSSKSVRILDVSADGGLLAYSIQEGGEDEVEVGFFDLDERRPLADRLPRTRYFSVSVLPGGHSVYYAREAVAGEGGRLYLHRLGTDPATDREVFGDGYGRGTTVWANLSDEGRYLVAHALSATGQRVDVFVKNLAEGGDFLEAVKGVESTFYGGVQGDVLVVQTDWQAPRGRVLVADPDHPEQAGWREVIPEHEKAVIRTVFGAGGKLFVEYLEDVQSRLAIFDIEGRELGEVPFPAIGSLHGIRGQWDQDDVYFSFSSFHIPVSIYRYEVATGALSVWSKAEASIAPEQFEVRQVWYPSRDGTQVPMFLIHPRDLKLDGSNPTLLTGYGGFSTSLTPAFSEETAAWIERGGVYVVANVRGGGELGEEWHQAAVREHKQRSFDDFIAAAEWLIEKGYTRPEKLALSGHSNGGLLVAAAMIQKPQLFRAVVCSHALLDMVRYNRFLAARFWLPEFGSPELPEYFWPIFDYSPYHRLTKGTTYPAVLFLTAADDTRVAPLHARKMTARMQALATPERPVLLRHYALGGHEVQGRPLSLRIDELTDTLSFLFWQLDEL
jgi:prolyl oligopeptidase